MPLIRRPAPPVAAPEPGSPEARLADLRGATTVPPLAAALLGEADARARDAILTSLARIGSVEAAEAMLPLLRSDIAARRTAALDALRIMPAALDRVLPGLLRDGDADVRLLACGLADAVADGPRLLCALLEAETEANVCAAALDVLAEAGDAACLPALARCAARFRDDPFLGFAVAQVTERIAPRG